MQDIKIVLLDFDDTLTISSNSWERLNQAFGVEMSLDKWLYDEYHSGRISYHAWVRRLVDLYKRGNNHKREVMEAVYHELTFHPHVAQVTNQLKEKGLKVGILTGSIEQIVQQTQNHYQIDFVSACHRAVFAEDGYLEDIVNFIGNNDVEMKLNWLHQIKDRFQVELHQIACLGDGVNERAIFEATGKGITFHGSPLEDIAWRVINDMTELPSLF